MKAVVIDERLVRFGVAYTESDGDVASWVVINVARYDSLICWSSKCFWRASQCWK